MGKGRLMMMLHRGVSERMMTRMVLHGINVSVCVDCITW